eukprot:CAMPEP_0184682640 /NCGR_PEP_ID=MMETSP0312-20130426/8019_1 /TAXON_ID=31354 /ORGANISM="Compsopogon coeruleus, Strain SAG 36.94" /LENGTH=36 /DNA_ID= /DNA_START= /DNA_END= /DNA_ORIENTATION=
MKSVHRREGLTPGHMGDEKGWYLPWTRSDFGDRAGT